MALALVAPGLLGDRLVGNKARRDLIVSAAAESHGTLALHHSRI
jgi:hypothetical protein